MTPALDREVVITGLGCISSLGHNHNDFWQALISGQSGIGKTQYPERASFSDLPVAEIKDYDPLDWFSSKALRLLDTTSQLALIAASEAVKDAGLDPELPLGSRCGVILGSGAGTRPTNDEVLEAYFEKGTKIAPFVIPKGMFCAPASQLAIEYGITGPSWMVTSTCASSNHAFGQAMMLIQNGQADMILAGGTEAPLTGPFVDAWRALRILDPMTCRPFSRERKGLVLGEAAGVLVLESRQHALQRNARIYASLNGFACTTDASDLLHISVAGATTAVKNALDSANVRPDQIDYVNAHGTGTQVNDVAETQIIHEVFGDHASQVLVSSTKSTHGHALGASGSLEMIAIAKTLSEQIVPPTTNFGQPCDECDLDYVPNEARSAKVNTAMSNAFGFGGLNAILVAKRFQE